MRLVVGGATMSRVDDELGAVVVVGGAGAIGTAVVRAYLGRGVRVIVVDRAPLTVDADPQRLAYVAADVTKDSDIALARDRVQSLGWDVRHLVSLAGRAMDSEFGRLTDTSETTIRLSLDLNLTSHVLLTRAFLPLLAFAAL